VIQLQKTHPGCTSSTTAYSDHDTYTGKFNIVTCLKKKGLQNGCNISRSAREKSGNHFEKSKYKKKRKIKET